MTNMWHRTGVRTCLFAVRSSPDAPMEPLYLEGGPFRDFFAAKVGKAWTEVLREGEMWSCSEASARSTSFLEPAFRY